MIKKSIKVDRATVIVSIGKNSWLSIVDSRSAMSAKMSIAELKLLRKLIKEAIDERRK